MHFNRSVNIAEIIRNGFTSYKESFIQFFKYALLVILVSHSIQLVSAFIDTFMVTHAIIYIILTSVIFISVIPIAYFAIRLNMTAARKFKAIVEKQPFDFRKEYKDSKHDFWRLFTVLATKFALKFIMLIASIPLLIQLMMYLGFDGFGRDYFSVYIIGPSVLILLFVAIVLLRLEFAAYAVYWHVDSEYTDLNTSIRMTKDQFFSKFALIVLSRLPSYLISGITIMTVFMNSTGSSMARWLTVIFIATINLVSLSWPISMYYHLFKELKAFKLSSKMLVDDEGNEWLTF